MKVLENATQAKGGRWTRVADRHAFVETGQLLV